MLEKNVITRSFFALGVLSFWLLSACSTALEMPDEPQLQEPTPVPEIAVFDPLIDLSAIENSEINELHLPHELLLRLTDTSGYDVSPIWSPNGDWIAFTSERSENKDIYLMDTDCLSFSEGSAADLIDLCEQRTIQLTDHPEMDTNPTWSPDGSKIVFSSNRDGDFDLYVIGALCDQFLASLDLLPEAGNSLVATRDDCGGEPTQITNELGNEDHPAWSADGTRIAFDSNRDGFPYEIYVLRLQDGQISQLTRGDGQDGNSSPVWSPDGSKIAHSSRRNGRSFIAITDSAGGNSQLLTTNPENEEFRPAWSPDGKWVAFDRFLFDESTYDVFIMNIENWPSRSSSEGDMADDPICKSDSINLTSTFAELRDNTDPFWSPDGGAIAFTASTKGNWDLHIMGLDIEAVCQLQFDRLGIEAELIQAPSGFTYAYDSILWRVNSEGVAVPLQSVIGYDFLLSPDRQLLLYGFENDYWVLDLETGEAQNITNTPEQWKKWPIWWPDYANLIVMCHGNYFPCGNVLVLDLTDLSQHILENERGFWCRPAPAPDGENLLLDSETLYNWKTGESSKFDFEKNDYGLDGIKLDCAAWSPDGKQIVWRASSQFQDYTDPGCEVDFEVSACGEDGAVVLDFERQTVKIVDFQPFAFDGPGGPNFNLSWSPDSEWITLYHYARTDSWEIAASDGSLSTGIRGEPNLAPVYRQDGKWIAYTGSDHMLYVAQVGVWEPMQVGPPSSQLVGWIE